MKGTDEENRLIQLAEQTLDVRRSSESYNWTPEMQDANPDLLEDFKSITEQEAVMFGEDWDAESAMASDGLYHQRDVLNYAIQQATEQEVDVLVFVVWDGVPFRMAKAAKEMQTLSETGHWNHTTIAPCIGEFPAMTNWGHLRLLHGLGLEQGLAQGLGVLNGNSRAHVPLAAYWGQLGNALDEGWQTPARESLIERTADILEPFLGEQEVSFGGYTGHRLGNLESNVLIPLVEAMESHQTIVTERGNQGEGTQLVRLRNLLSLDRQRDGVTLAFSRISFDSRGGNEHNHMALNFSGHMYGPYNPAIISGLNRSWDELCELVESCLNGRKALIVACSDHGMTPTPNLIEDTWAISTPEDCDGDFLAETATAPRPWFSERGVIGNSQDISDNLYTRVQQTSGLECSIDSARIPDTELIAMSLRHGWSFDSHRGQHGGIGFDDLVIPLMTRQLGD